MIVNGGHGVCLTFEDVDLGCRLKHIQEALPLQEMPFSESSHRSHQPVVCSPSAIFRRDIRGLVLSADVVDN